MATVNLLNVNIDNLTTNDAINKIGELLQTNSDTQHLVTTPNVDHLVRLQHDEEFHRIYKDASLVLADGAPLLWASNYLKTPLKEKISGSDLFPRLCEWCAENEYKVFFLGGREGAAVSAAEKLTTLHPKLQVVGTYCPPFGFENDEAENTKIINMIRETKPHILFVGLGAPKQEKWIYYNRKKYEAPVSIGIGVSFEFIAGIVKRAPKLMQKVGLEWFWRVLCEPRRLWRRYFVDDMVFFKLVFRQKKGKLINRFNG